MAFRLLRYLVRIWEAFLVEHPTSQHLPAIIPVVVHHGRDGWTATDLCSLLHVDDETLALVKGHVPQFRFIVDDLSWTDDADLRERSLSALALAALMLLSRGRDSPSLLDDLWRWQEAFSQVASARNGVEALSAFLEYAFRVGDILPDHLREFADQLGPIAQEAYMTAAEKLTAESYAQGRAEGKAELLIRQLGLRFGPLSVVAQEKILQAASERLDVWAERVITGGSLDEVLG